MKYNINVQKLRKNISIVMVFAMLLSVANIAPLLELSFAFASEDSVTDDVYGVMDEVYGTKDNAPMSKGKMMPFGADTKTITLNTLADKTEVWVGEPFTYTIQYSYASTGEHFENEKILLELPGELEYVEATLSPHVKSINANNSPIEVFMNDTIPAGTTSFFKVTVRFKAGNIIADKSVRSTVTDGGGTVTAVQTPAVTGKVKSDWTWGLQKERIVPSESVLPAVGSDVTYRITAKGNAIEGGWNVQNVSLTDIYPEGAVFVDATGSPAHDSANRTLIWNIGELKAGETKVYFVTLRYPAEDPMDPGNGFSVGDPVTNEALLKGERYDRDTKSLADQATHSFAAPTPGVGKLDKRSRQDNDRYTIGQTMVFYIGGFANTGNVPLDSITLVDTIPDGMDLESVTEAGADKVYYQTNADTDWIEWSPTNAKPIGIGTNYIKAVKWEYNDVPVGFTPSEIELEGKLLAKYREAPNAGNDVKNEDRITNTVSLEAINPTVNINDSDEETVHVGDLPGTTPWPVVSKTASKPSVYEEESLQYTIRLRNHDYATGELKLESGQSIEITDVLPQYNGNDIFEDFTFDPDDVTGTFTSKGTISFNSAAKKWTLTGLHLKQKEYIDIRYTVKVKKGVRVDRYTNEASFVINGVTVDDRTKPSLKASESIFVRFTGSMTSAKGVRGHQETSFSFPNDTSPLPVIAETLEGGVVRYQLKVQNVDSNGPITNLVIIDKLPHIGDTGVWTSGPRSTAWEPYLVNEVTGENGAALNPGIKIFYSTSTNPDRSKLQNPLGTDTGWSSTPPADITSVRSLKFEFGNITFEPNGTPIILEWEMRAPVGAPINDIAWNSFAYGATYTEINSSGVEYQQPFLPSEPIKVGMKVVANEESTTRYALGDYIWVDVNKNGIQDAGEIGYNGILVELYDSTGNAILDKNGDKVYTRTGDDHNGKKGYYKFPDLAAGDYVVKFKVPATYHITGENQGEDTTTDSNFIRDNSDHADWYRAAVTLAGDDFTIDAGIYQKSSVGDFVWNDRTQNNQHNSGEPGIPNVTVKLWQVDTLGEIIGSVPVATQVTNADGWYSFTNLDPGRYIIEFVKPSNDFVFVSQTKSAGDLPTNNRSFPDPNTGRTPVFTLTSNQHITNIDAGMYLGQIGDKVWHDLNANGIQDAGEPGISGVTVKLRNTSGNPVQNAFGVTVADVTTNGSGNYSFNDLKAGDYIVEFVMPTGYDKFSPKDVGSVDGSDSDADPTTGKTGTITLVAGERNLTIDAGLYKLASIGDFVWHDTNFNGTQNPGELGMQGVIVNLLDSGKTKIATMKTLANGSYRFDRLEPGTYYVQFVNDNSDYLFTKPNQGNDTTDSDTEPNDDHTVGLTGSYTLGSGDAILTVDAGLYEMLPSIQIEKTVYAGHNTGSSVGTELVSGQSGTLVTYRFAVTNTGNTYLRDIAIDDADLEIDKGQMIHKSGDKDLLAPGESVIYYYETTITENLVNTASTTGTPCYDEYANPIPSKVKPTDDDTAEVVLVVQGIKLDKTVYAGHDSGDQTGGDYLLAEIGSDITYVFTVTNTGDKHLKDITIEDADILVAGNPITEADMVLKSGSEPLASGDTLVYYYETTISGNLTNRAETEGTPCQSDGTPYIHADKPSDVDTADVEISGTIGDTVWYDIDGNGIQDAGEPGVEGITVELYQNGTKIDETVTDQNGYYKFTDLGSGMYTVKVIPGTVLDGYAPIYDLDGTLDHETIVSLNSGDDIDNADFGYQPIPNLFIKKEVDKELVRAGETVVYTITIENRGKGTLNNVWLRDPMLEIEEFIATFNSGDSFTITDSYVIANSDRPGPVVNIATATSDEVGPVEDSAEVSIRRPSGGGGGGGTPPPVPEPEKPKELEKPVKPEEKPEEPKKPEEKPEEPEKPGEKPEDPNKPGENPGEPDKPGEQTEQPTVKEKTPEETPVGGKVEVPEQSTTEVTDPPRNGTVTVNEDGTWEYTPEPGFVGKDTFKIKIKHPDGTEEEVFIEIEVGEIPLGAITPPGVGQLPKTGEINPAVFYILGFGIILTGAVMLRRSKVLRGKVQS